MCWEYGAYARGIPLVLFGGCGRCCGAAEVEPRLPPSGGSLDGADPAAVFGGFTPGSSFWSLPVTTEWASLSLADSTPYFPLPAPSSDVAASIKASLVASVCSKIFLDITTHFGRCVTRFGTYEPLSERDKKLKSYSHPYGEVPSSILGSEKIKVR